MFVKRGSAARRTTVMMAGAVAVALIWTSAGVASAVGQEGLTARNSASTARLGAEDVAASVPMARPGFSAPSYYPVGADAVVVGDFTGDGRADVAVAFPDSPAATAGTVALLAQTSSGTLSPPEYISAHTGDFAFVSAAAADINGDGLTDLLVGSSNGIDVFVQQDGGLLPGRLITDLAAEEIKVADINGDGRPDLVIDTYSSGLWTMLNLGGGQFGPPVQVSTDAARYQDFAVGDVTGDGIPDIVGHNVISVEVRVGRGDSTFAPPIDYPIPQYNDGGLGLALGDFNGDGRTDVAVTNSSNNPEAAVHVFYQTPTGTLGPAVTLPTLDVPDMIKSVDVNHDGRTDLVVAHGGWDYVGVYLQQPDGTFSPEQLYYTGQQDFDASSGLDVADINGDGLPDIVLGSAGGLEVLSQTPGGAPAATTLVTRASSAATVGGPISDTATLSGGFYPTGTMRFAVFGPNDPTCSNGAIFTTTIQISGNGTYSSAPFTTSTGGTYRFEASYSGDANNTSAGPDSCSDPSQSVAVAGNAIFTNPWDGQPNVDTTMPFTWKTLAAAQGYILVVGTTGYGSNLMNSGILPASQSSFPMPDLPAGPELFATLLTKVNGAWSGFQAVIFTAAVGHATFTNPLATEANVDTSKPFTWSTLAAAQGYILVVGTTQYGSDLVNSGILPASQSSFPMPVLPAGQTLYATLLTKVNGAWSRFQAIAFTAGHGGTRR